MTVYDSQKLQTASAARPKNNLFASTHIAQPLRESLARQQQLQQASSSGASSPYSRPAAKPFPPQQAPLTLNMDRLQHVFDLIQIQAGAARSAFARGSHGEAFGILEDVAGAIRYAQEAKRLTDMHRKGIWDNGTRRVPSRNGHRRPSSARRTPDFARQNHADINEAGARSQESQMPHGQRQTDGHLVGPVPISAYRVNRKRLGPSKYERPHSRKSHRSGHTIRGDDYFSNAPNSHAAQSFSSSSVSSPWSEPAYGRTLSSSPAPYNVSMQPEYESSQVPPQVALASTEDTARFQRQHSQNASWPQDITRPTVMQFNSSPSISLSNLSAQRSHFSSVNASLPGTPSTPVHHRSVSHLHQVTNSFDDNDRFHQANSFINALDSRNARTHYDTRAQTPQSPPLGDEHECNQDNEIDLLAIDPELKAKLDDVFFRFLQQLCSDLKMTDPAGETIHQTLMPKKMQRLDESPNFRPFKFRIQAFSNALQDQINRTLGDGVVSGKKLRQYLWTQKHISRFNEDGRKSKSKGNHIWEIQARRIPASEGRAPSWVFKEYSRKIVGDPSDHVASIGVYWEWAPRVWDPQVSTSSLRAVFSSPPNSLPSWLAWRDNVLAGTPPESLPVTTHKQDLEIIASARFLDNGENGEISRSIHVTLDTSQTVERKSSSSTNHSSVQASRPIEMMDLLPDMRYNSSMMSQTALSSSGGSGILTPYAEGIHSTAASLIDSFAAATSAQGLDNRIAMTRDHDMTSDHAGGSNTSGDLAFIRQPIPTRARQLTGEYPMRAESPLMDNSSHVIDPSTVARNLTMAPSGLATAAALQVVVAATAAANNMTGSSIAPESEIANTSMQNLIRAAQTSMEASVMVENLEREEAATIDGTVEKVQVQLQVEAAKAEAQKAAAVLEVQAQVQVQAVQVAQIKALHEVASSNGELLQDMSMAMDTGAMNNPVAMLARNKIDGDELAKAVQAQVQAHASQLEPMNNSMMLQNASLGMQTPQIMPPPALPSSAVSNLSSSGMDAVDALLASASNAANFALATAVSASHGLHGMPAAPPPTPLDPSVPLGNSMQASILTPTNRSRASSNVSGHIPLAYGAPEMGMPPDPRAALSGFDTGSSGMSVESLNGMAARATLALDQALAQVQKDFM